MYICHILFIHLSVDGHLVCFQFLAIVNNAAVTTDLQVSESLPSILLGMYLEMELLDHMFILYLISEKTA